jgi:hypothetical protein
MDIAISGVAKDNSFKLVVDDRMFIHHMRSGVRKKVGSFDPYINTSSIDLERWQCQFPELRKYGLHT